VDGEALLDGMLDKGGCSISSRTSSYSTTAVPGARARSWPATIRCSVNNAVASVRARRTEAAVPAGKRLIAYRRPRRSCTCCREAAGGLALSRAGAIENTGDDDLPLVKRLIRI